MFSAIRRAFGVIKVSESPKEISVQGVPADTLARDISKMWSTNRINQNLFTAIGKNSFSFHPFFAVEVHYMLQQIDQYRNSRSAGRTVRAIMHEMEEKTWLKRISEEHPSKVNLAKLSNLNFSMLPHQDKFLKDYSHLTQQYNLHGYLLAAQPGTGKTVAGLALAECLEADLTIVVCPKPALHRVWTSTVSSIYKKPRPYWVAEEADKRPYKNEPIAIAHFEALPKLIDGIKNAHAGKKVVIILDESHNVNELKSQRTQLFLDLCKMTGSQNVLWMSGTPIKAMGYEAIPLLRSVDPLFTPEVEARFMKIFGKASDRALDILKHRLGKVSYHIAGKETISVKKSTENWQIKIPNATDYTLATIREKMRKFVAERMAHYQANFKSYQKKYDAGIAAFEKVMRPEQKADFAKYQRAIREISRGYDPDAHKDIAAFANQFERKVLIPSIQDKAIRDGFKESKSVIKYVSLKVMGEALGTVVGKSRAQCQIDMAKHTDWKAIAEKSAKKVIVFTSYVEALKTIESEIKKAGFKTLVAHGEVGSNLAGIVEQFAKDPNIKFLVATYQMLSTAVPLVMADLTVFTNAPFRQHELEQAEARTARIGQDSPVTYIHTYLDTGKEPNISTRSKDILEWSKAQIEAIVGEGDSEGISKELNRDYNLGAMESYIEKGTQFAEVFAAMEAYHALDEGTFTHRGKRYDLNLLLKKAEHLPVQSLPVEDLKWVLSYDTPDPERKKKADKHQPLLVVREPRYGEHADTVVDGLHRLSQMVDDGDVLASVKVIPTGWLKEAEV